MEASRVWTILTEDNAPGHVAAMVEGKGVSGRGAELIPWTNYKIFLLEVILG